MEEGNIQATESHKMEDNKEEMKSENGKDENSIAISTKENDKCVDDDQNTKVSQTNEIKPTFQPPSMPAPSMHKVPVKKKTVKSFPIKRGGLPSDIYQAPKIAQFLNEETPPVVSKEKIIKPNTPAAKQPPAVLEYESPTWAKLPTEKLYSLEVLKNGSIIKKIELSGKHYFTVGRLKDCDIPMEHPLISRYHAIFQFGCPGETAEDVELQKDGSFGLYLYDIGSTHGTFLNKVRIPNEKYFRLKVGHVMKFGGSSRMFILHGPDEDQEETAKESVAELKEMFKKRKKEKEDLAKKMLGEDSDESDNETSVEKVQSVTWGLSEDAVTINSDEDSDDDTKKKKNKNKLPLSDGKERFYVKDPVKALKHFYEQEKIEIEFEYTERRPGHWYARLEMPFDGPGGKVVYAESEITGKKKDAANACALEACKLLDKEGFFKQSEHHKKKAKKWKEADYYDSDEDEFLDRTGEISKKRMLRMKRTGDVKEVKAENYDSLCAKVKLLESEVNEINNKLTKDKQVTKVDESSADPLDDFMKQIKSGKALDTITRSKLKVRLVEARKELAQAIRLADLARPASMPKLQVSSGTQSFSFIGKMKSKRKLGVVVPKSFKSNNTIKFSDTDLSKNEEEKEEDEEELVKTDPMNEKTKEIIEKSNLKETHNEIPTTSKTSLVENNDKEKLNTSTGESKKIIKSPEKIQSTDSSEKNGPKINKGSSNIKIEDKFTQNIKTDESKYDTSAIKSTKKRVMQPTLPLELRQKLLEESEKMENEPTQETNEPEPKRKRGRKPRSNPHKINNSAYEGDDKYVTWMPPENQTGDGSTNLNKKLGY